jgi:hypothetical protein
VTEKVEVIREVNKKERSESEMALAYGIPLATLPMCLRNWGSLNKLYKGVMFQNR